MIVLIAIGALCAILLGGLFALRFHDKLHLVLGFSAGSVIAVAFFDLLPEAVELAGESYEVHAVAGVIALGFLGFMLLDRIMSGHTHSPDDGHDHGSGGRGVLGAMGIALHSFLDGLAIGLAFQVSTSLGAIVATAVLVHGFSDGINTVSLILKGTGQRKRAFRWLAADAAAPVLGILASTRIAVADATLGLLLAAFCGFFLYLGASDLLPESYHRHPTAWTTFMTLVGVLVLYAAISIAGH